MKILGMTCYLWIHITFDLLIDFWMQFLFCFIGPQASTQFHGSTFCSLLPPQLTKMYVFMLKLYIHHCYPGLIGIWKNSKIKAKLLFHMLGLVVMATMLKFWVYAVENTNYTIISNWLGNSAASIRHFAVFGLTYNMLVKRHIYFLALGFLTGVDVIWTLVLLYITTSGVDTISSSITSLSFYGSSHLPAC